jgi:aryl-alcohol dehydrogenase-like predicted oxidoreductase
MVDVHRPPVSWRRAAARPRVLAARTSGLPHRDREHRHRVHPGRHPRHHPAFDAGNRTANQALLDHVTALARARDAAPGQIALAWLLAQYQQISPIPGTRRRERLEENAGATRVALSADDVADLNAAAAAIGVHGDRYGDHHLNLTGR